MLSCRFQQCLDTFTILLVKASSEERLFRHLSNHVFGVLNFGTAKAVRVIFFLKCLKFNVDFKNAAKCHKNVTFSEIIASELESLNCRYQEQDAFHRQPMS